MECFHGYYKDGTNDTRDCRYVAGFYFVIRMLLYSLCAYATHLRSFIPLASGILVTFALFIAVLQPYKNRYKINNITDPLFLLLAGLLGKSINLFGTGNDTHSHSVVIASALRISLILLCPMLYIVAITLGHLYYTTPVQKVKTAMRSTFLKCKERIRPKDDEDEQQIAQIHAERSYETMENT